MENVLMDNVLGSIMNYITEKRYIDLRDLVSLCFAEE